jgi:LysM repeat protein
MKGRALASVLVVALAAGCGGGGQDPGAGTTTAPTTEVVATTAATTTTTAPQQVVYVVQAGDSLSVIAQRFGVTVDAIAQANAIADVHSIRIGDELVIPPPGTATTVATGEAEQTTTTVG